MMGRGELVGGEPIQVVGRQAADSFTSVEITRGARQSDSHPHGSGLVR